MSWEIFVDVENKKKGEEKRIEIENWKLEIEKKYSSGSGGVKV